MGIINSRRFFGQQQFLILPWILKADIKDCQRFFGYRQNRKYSGLATEKKEYFNMDDPF